MKIIFYKFLAALNIEIDYSYITIIIHHHDSYRLFLLPVDSSYTNTTKLLFGLIPSCDHIGQKKKKIMELCVVIKHGLQASDEDKQN